MTDRSRTPEKRQADLAPETHNSEQDESGEQAQDVAQEARGSTTAESPLDSKKAPGNSNVTDDSTQDVIDHMRDMEQSGRIDMDAYRGEPNHDDNEDKYGPARKIDNLRSDGT